CSQPCSPLCLFSPFMRWQQVLFHYKKILQAIRPVSNDSDNKYLKDWAREEFKRNKSTTEEVWSHMLCRIRLKEDQKQIVTLPN
uniref:Complex 1 LYR protein domain-containing protein n=1 Tax=Piliocolobus tephrosceles TaxID=591936 RepID=A0A8C9I4V3_9PRIM